MISDSRFRKGDLERLVAVMCDGTLTPEDQKQLNDLLCHNAAAQDYYLEYIWLHGTLHWHQGKVPRESLPHQANRNARIAFHGSNGNSLTREHGDALFRSAFSTSDGSQSQELTVRESTGGRSIQGTCKLTVPSVLFCVAAACLIVFLVTSSFYRSDEKNPKSGQVAHRALPDGKVSAGQYEFAGAGKYQNDSGTGRISLPNVGYVIVDGPTDLELITPMRMRLNRGRIRVRVTEPAGHGFVVETPHGEMTDLGTEFGVDVSGHNATNLVVFEGAVDVKIPAAESRIPIVEKLIGGEGLRFSRSGRFDRIMSIKTGRESVTFRTSNDHRPRGDAMPLIVDVSDDLRVEDTRRFYEIVHGGMGEDVLAYVDRPYEWNGVDRSGMPKFLVGADYVKTFNDDRLRSFEITLQLGKPADMYIFWDDRIPPPEWLTYDFQDSDLDIALDIESCKYFPGSGIAMGRGPGVDVDYRHSVWHRRVATPQSIKLGSLQFEDTGTAMYGIAVVAAEQRALEAKPDHFKSE